jgi:hypothetical protein
MIEIPNVAKIVREYLIKNSYDGLCNPDLECGCRLDDFMPCAYGSWCGDCIPGYVTQDEEGNEITVKEKPV